MSVYELMIGKKFSKLTVLELMPQSGRYVDIKCRCECGFVVIKRAHSVKKGDTKGCGNCKFVSVKRQKKHDEWSAGMFSGVQKRRNHWRETDEKAMQGMQSV